MNLATGHYFSAQGTGSELWALIEAAATERQLVEHLRLRYQIDDVEARAGVASFLAQLRDHELVVSGAGEVPAPVGESPASLSPTPYAIPQLNVHSDMKDLLLLDPIHDVSEAGWPMQKPADS